MPSRWMCCLCLAGLVLSSAVEAENWPRFRGADGSGVSADATIPTVWTEKDYDWVVDIPGVGHAAPIIWGDRLFVTTATDEGRLRHLFCLDSATGKEIWSRSQGFNTNPKHAKSSYASSTPATDGERVYVAFADQEKYTLTAYDFDGNLLWRNLLGPFSSQHGQGTSPIVFEDLVILANDQDGASSIIAVNRLTGRTVWSTPRTSREASYATPIIVEAASERPILVAVAGATGITGHDPWSGETLWSTNPFPKRTVASPVLHNGLVLATCGSGGKASDLIGVDPNGSGNVAESHVKLHLTRSIPYVPTLISHGGLLFSWGDGGVVSCLDTGDDKVLWQERVGGSYSGSPICIDGKIYAISESGEVVVVGAAPSFHLYGRSPLGDASHSTPAVANGRLYLRSFHKLACLKSKAAN